MANNIIIGAGMAGCLAGVLDPTAIIYEAAPALPAAHRAVLRFREDKISRATGIPFKKVNVRKAIWHNEQEVQPTPRLANLYSRKVTGKILDRSIWNIEPVTRYIAPENFHQMLGDMCNNRIEFNSPVETIDSNYIWINGDQLVRLNIPIISTIPMPILAKATHSSLTEDFKFQSINVTRFKIPDCDVYQTVYYPDMGCIYRATLTGEDLIVESAMWKPQHNDFVRVAVSLGISPSQLTEVESETIEQRYGKIAPINDTARKNFMLQQTLQNNIYSLGRFACWRNILLDDVYDDFYKIKRMIQSDHYSNFLEAHHES